ncbi:MAG: TIGR03668 family PPOX class F420-dependent oxidoreductase [Chloroflexota bacterium]|nr:TIGR03668 family PPOX class F420-dependent oxidoreductase [Chloroflexota bacterium]
MQSLSPNQMKLLANAPVGHLSTAGKGGAPHVIPVCFALDSRKDGAAIYIALDQKPKRAPLTRLRRVRNILENPQVALVVDHYEADWAKLWYILVTGAAEVLEEVEDDYRRHAVQLLRRKYPQYREMDIDENPVIKITPGRVAAWAYTPELTP